MTRLRIGGWVEAESLMPGCSAEWSEMLTGVRTRGLPEGQFQLVWYDGPVPGTHGDPGRVTLELSWHDLRHAGRPTLVVTQEADPERWIHPPSWVRWPSGGWTAPMPAPRTLVLELSHLESAWAGAGGRE